jgi:O-antigen/teichoic acid export membrane protein
VFALFLAICNNLAPLATLQYPAGFVSARSNDEFYQILQITFAVLTGSTVLLIVVCFLFGDPLLNVLHAQSLNGYVYLIPLYFFLMGLDTTLLGWNIKLKEFKRGAVAKIISVTLSKGTTVALGLVAGANALGMIIGNLLTYPFESGVKLSAGMKAGANELFKRHRSAHLAATLHHFRAYPKYVTTGLILSNFSAQLPVYYFSLVFASSLGYFALANGVIVVPLSIIILSSTTVLLQKAAEVKLNSPENLRVLAGTVYSRLFYLSFIPLVAFAFVSDWLFRFVFGQAWEQAGVFAAFLAVAATLSVPAQPLSVFFRIMGRERVNFAINIVFVFLKFGALWWGAMNDSIILSIIAYSLSLILSNVVQLFYIFRMVEHPTARLVRDTVIVLVAFALVVFVKTQFIR